MSNRLLAILILLTIFGGVFAFVAYFYIYYTGDLKVKSNISGYSINLKSDTIKNSFSFFCKKKDCLYKDLPPVDLYYTASKSGYEDIFGVIEVKTGKLVDLDLTFDKKEEIQEIEKKPEIVSVKNKIQKIKEQKRLEKYFKYFDFDKKGIFYLKEESNKLVLYKKLDKKDEKLYSLAKLDKSEIMIFDIKGNSTIVISIPSRKIIYNLITGKTDILDLKIPLKYAKKYGNNYIFVTEKGSFIYDILLKKIEYFYLFKDFINYGKQSFIGIKEDKNILYIYNSKTKNIRVLFELDYNIKQILNINNIIYIISEDGEEFILKNIKE